MFVHEGSGYCKRSAQVAALKSTLRRRLVCIDKCGERFSVVNRRMKYPGNVYKLLKGSGPITDIRPYEDL